jgi:AraC-like DNA-binding protein
MIAGNPHGASLHCSSSLAQSVLRGRFWDEPVADGILFRLVDLAIEQTGWLKITQDNVNISCVSMGTFASSFFQRGDANAHGPSLRVFTLGARRSQLVIFPRPTRYRVMQLCIAPERAKKILSDLDHDPNVTMQAMESACHRGKMFTVKNLPLPDRVDEIANEFLLGTGGRQRLHLYARALEILAAALDAIVAGKTATDIRETRIARIEMAASILAANIESPLDLPALARHVGLGPDTLERGFRSHLEMTPRRYLSNLRMLEAARLIQSADLSIAEIGRLVGFTNHSAFTRAYGRVFGRSPRAMKTPGGWTRPS